MCPILKILIREIPVQPEMPSEKMTQLVGKIYQNQKYVMVNIGTSELQKNCWKNMDTQKVVQDVTTNELDWITGSTPLSAAEDWKRQSSLKSITRT